MVIVKEVFNLNQYYFCKLHSLIVVIERLVSNNLIDLNCEAPPPPPTHNYVNDFVVGNKNHNSQLRDVFDMRMLLVLP